MRSTMAGVAGVIAWWPLLGLLLSSIVAGLCFLAAAGTSQQQQQRGARGWRHNDQARYGRSRTAWPTTNDQTSPRRGLFTNFVRPSSRDGVVSRATYGSIAGVEHGRLSRWLGLYRAVDQVDSNLAHAEIALAETRAYLRQLDDGLANLQDYTRATRLHLRAACAAGEVALLYWLRRLLLESWTSQLQQQQLQGGEQRIVELQSDMDQPPAYTPLAIRSSASLNSGSSSYSSTAKGQSSASANSGRSNGKKKRSIFSRPSWAHKASSSSS